MPTASPICAVLLAPISTEVTRSPRSTEPAPSPTASARVAAPAPSRRRTLLIGRRSAVPATGNGCRWRHRNLQDAVQITIGQQAARQRGEGDRADAMIRQRIQQFPSPARVQTSNTWAGGSPGVPSRYRDVERLARARPGGWTNRHTALLPWRTNRSSAAMVSSSGVSGSGRW